jgi:transposase
MQLFLISHLLRAALVCGAVRSLIAVSTTLNEQVKTLQGQMEADFGRHPDAEIYLSQPGLGPILGARVLGEFGDDPHRYATDKARKNYAATSPITRASGKKTVMARFVRNDRFSIQHHWGTPDPPLRLSPDPPRSFTSSPSSGDWWGQGG